MVHSPVLFGRSQTTEVHELILAQTLFTEFAVEARDVSVLEGFAD